MKKIFFATLLIALASGCNPTSPEKKEIQVTNEKAEAATISERAEACVCTKMYLPVCGENKQTYPNSCEADCAGVKYTMGACGELE